jgi:hypothetical protein
MRVYVPDKRDRIIKEALKELYLLRQSIDFQSGTVGARLELVDKIRSKIHSLTNENSSDV